MDNNSYLVGLLCGAIATAFIAFILNQVTQARKQMGGADRTLDKFPQSKQSDLTPNAIVHTSRSAAFSYILWMFALIVVLILSCAGLSLVLRL